MPAERHSSGPAPHALRAPLRSSPSTHRLLRSTAQTAPRATHWPHTPPLPSPLLDLQLPSAPSLLGPTSLRRRSSQGSRRGSARDHPVGHVRSVCTEWKAVFGWCAHPHREATTYWCYLPNQAHSFVLQLLLDKDTSTPKLTCESGSSRSGVLWPPRPTAAPPPNCGPAPACPWPRCWLPPPCVCVPPAPLAGETIKERSSRTTRRAHALHGSAHTCRAKCVL